MTNFKSLLITTLSGRYIRTLSDRIRSAVGRGGLRIINFHRVLDNKIDLNDYRYLGESPTIDDFDRMLNFLSSHYNVISIKDYIENIENHDPGKLFVAITFDDGYLDNYTNALPILRKYNVPATIFVSMDALDKKPLWFQQIYYAIDVCAKDEIVNPCDNEVVSLRNKWAAMQTLCKSILKLPVDDYVGKINDLYDQCGVALDYNICDSEKMMSWSEVDNLKSEPLVDIGSHAVTHFPLVNLSDDELKHELLVSFQGLKESLGYEKVHMAYPNGMFDERVIRYAKEVGYAAAFSMERGTNDAKTDQFQMKREYVFNNPRRIGFQLDNWDLRIKKALRLDH
jgi:peptidoglycan/xylan/chitin deacetylase (PgdA/CDA1 family)